MEIESRIMPFMMIVFCVSTQRAVGKKRINLFRCTVSRGQVEMRRSVPRTKLLLLILLSICIIFVTDNCSSDVTERGCVGSQPEDSSFVVLQAYQAKGNDLFCALISAYVINQRLIKD